MTVRFLQTVDVPGYPRFEEGSEHVLDSQLTQELLGRNLVVEQAPRQQEAKSKKRHS